MTIKFNLSDIAKKSQDQNSRKTYSFLVNPELRARIERLEVEAFLQRRARTSELLREILVAGLPEIEKRYGVACE